MVASEAGHEAVVAALLQAGADVNAKKEVHAGRRVVTTSC